LIFSIFFFSFYSRFPIAKPFDKTDNLILEPNLNPGEIGINYTVVCHTNYQQKLNDPKLPLNVAIQLIGEKNNTNFIPLQHSQINKVPFLAGRRDIFSIVTADVGRVSSVNFNYTIYIAFKLNFLSKIFLDY